MQATYSPSDNKLRIYPDSRLDEDTYKRVREVGYAWAPQQKLFVCPRWTPQAEDLAIELAGEIEDEDVSPEERATVRAARFAEYHARRAQDAERAQDAVSAIADNIPLGQPILVGHHSERHARKDAERIENGMRKAVRLWETSAYWKARAIACKAHARYVELPDVRARRIKKLEAEERKYAKALENAEKFDRAWRRLDEVGFLKKKNGEESTPVERAAYLASCDWQVARLSSSDIRDGKITAQEARDQALAKHGAWIVDSKRWLDHIHNRLAYEREMLAGRGGLVADRFDLQPGGQVLLRGSWYIITKINRTDDAIRSVTVLGHYARTIQIEDVADYRAPAEGVAEKVEAATKLAPMCNYPGEGFKRLTRAEWDQHKQISDIRHAIKHQATEQHGAHRTRATHGPNWTTVAVYVTDMKRVDPPAPTNAPSEPPRIETLPREPRLPRDLVPVDPAQANVAALKQALKTGVQIVTAPQLFPTPHDLVLEMLGAAALERGMTVLEPSAGTGNIAKALHAADLDLHIDMVEINHDLCKGLEAAGFERSAVTCADFLTIEPPFCPDAARGFDRILANPPFERGADIAHIKHALRFLGPGGRLVAICADGPRQKEQLQPLATTWKSLPENTFAAQGTYVRTAMIVIDAP